MDIKFTISATLLTTTLLLIPINSQITLAGTCASNCRRSPLRFTPGQYIQVQIINRSYDDVKLEQLPELRKTTLKHGEKLQFNLQGGELDKFSLMFWNDSGRPVKGVVSKLKHGTLVLEIRPSREYPGDRSLEILSDGRISVL